MEETPKLIDLAYASTIDPHRYDDFMDCWQVHLDEVLAASPWQEGGEPDPGQANHQSNQESRNNERQVMHRHGL